MLPVEESVKHWFASPRAATQFLLHAAEIDTAPLGSRRSLTMPGLAATVGEEIEALRRVAGEKAVKLIRREPNPAVAKIISGWPAELRPEARRRPRVQGREILRRDHPRAYRGRTRQRPARIDRPETTPCFSVP